MSGSCHIRSVEIVVELGIFVFFKFSDEKKLRSYFAFWDTFKLLSSKDIKLQSSIRVTCILFKFQPKKIRSKIINITLIEL